MPLPPLEPNNTGRYFVDYFSNTAEHTFMLRYNPVSVGAPPDTTFIARVATVLNDIKTLLPTDFAILRARYSLPGSTVTVPTSAPAAPTGMSLAPVAALVPAFVSFVGRAPSGRKVRFTLLGVGVSATTGAIYSDYRVRSAELATIGTVVTNLNGAPFVAIDGTAPTWYPYANTGFNAYWQKEVRSSS